MTENKDPQYYKLRYIFISLYLKEHEKKERGISEHFDWGKIKLMSILSSSPYKKLRWAIQEKPSGPFYPFSITELIHQQAINKNRLQIV